MILPIVVSVSGAQLITPVGPGEVPNQFRLHITYEEGAAAGSPIRLLGDTRSNVEVVSYSAEAAVISSTTRVSFLAGLCGSVEDTPAFLERPPMGLANIDNMLVKGRSGPLGDLTSRKVRQKVDAWFSGVFDFPSLIPSLPWCEDHFRFRHTLAPLPVADMMSRRGREVNETVQVVGM